MADPLDDVFPEPQAESPEVEVVAPEPIELTPDMEVPSEPQPEEIKPEPAADRGAGYVPIDAMLTERERRQDAERRLAEFERQRQPAVVPDSFDDPAGYNAYVQQQIDTAVQKNKVDTSWTLAVRDHGKDKVEEARQWALEKAQSDPVFRNQVDAAFATEALPIDWVVQQHKRNSDLQMLGDMSLQDYIEAEIAKRTAGSPSAPAPALAVADLKPASPPVRVPRSLASQGTAPSDIRQTASGPLAGVDALFG